MLDRSHHPTHKPCAGGLTIKTLNLMPYSVAPVIERIVTGVTIGVHFEGAERPEHFSHEDAICAFSVRSRFDALNFDRALEVGAEFATATSIDRIDQQAAAVATAVGGRTITFPLPHRRRWREQRRVPPDLRRALVLPRIRH
jgi:flavin-dependent dehydrogenase